MRITSISRMWPLFLLILCLGLFFYFGFNQYLSFTYVQAYYLNLQAWTQSHYCLAVTIFMAVYILVISASIPGAVFFTLIGGFLFGIVWGSIYVIFSATIGATLLFLAVKLALKDRQGARTGKWVSKLKQGFQENAFSYLLILRLLPIFPFWVVNIVPALLNIPIKTYVTATFIGIIPGSVIYVMVGNGLGHVFALGQTPNLQIIFSPEIMLPLLGLAFLIVLPIIYRHYQKG